MTKTSKPIVFFGSGPVAAKSLRLLAQDFTIEAVVTKPRPSHHKGDVPVLTTAEDLKLPIKTVANRRELDALFANKPFQSQLGVLIDFGIIVSQQVIDYFPLGIVNSHFSILPEWRGADPITFAVLSGQKTTGVSLMFLVAAMDEGPLLSYNELPLDNDITTPELTEKLIHLSDTLLKHDLPGLLAGQSQGGTPQSITGRQVSYSRKISKEDGVIDWAKPADLLEREIRAFAGWPQSRGVVNDIEIIITKAHAIDATGPAGHHLVRDKQLIVYCGEKALAVDRLKPIGKKEMTSEAFLAGHRKNLA